MNLISKNGGETSMKKIYFYLQLLFIIAITGALLGIENQAEAAEYSINNPTTDSTGKTT